MNLRNIDGTKIVNLSKGSHKKIIFDCDSCNTSVEQSYRNYLRQTDGKFCRICRNKHTAARPDVKENQSNHTKEMWKDDEYRKVMSTSLSIGCKKGWNTENGYYRKKCLSNNNPMYDNETIEKVRLKLTENTDTIRHYIDSIGYSYISHIRKNNKVVVKYKCNNGHITHQRLNDIRNGHRCNNCFNSRSLSEKEMSSFIKEHYNGLIIENDRTTIKNPHTSCFLELDIFLPDINVAIEFNGEYWHKDPLVIDRDIIKQKICDEKNITLVTVWYSDWAKDKEGCLNKILTVIK